MYTVVHVTVEMIIKYPIVSHTVVYGTGIVVRDATTS
jgi:hypothetical protein